MKKVVLIGGIVCLALLPAERAFTDAGAEVVYLLIVYLAVWPVYSVIVGIYTGRGFKKRWFLPLITSGAFVLCASVSLFMGFEVMLLLYAALYAAAAYIVAVYNLASAKVSAKLAERNQNLRRKREDK